MAAKILTPLQAIKEKCKNNCCAGDVLSWKNCPAVSCPLWAYRLGKRPKRLPFEEYQKKRVDSPLNSGNKATLQRSSE